MSSSNRENLRKYEILATKEYCRLNQEWDELFLKNQFDDTSQSQPMDDGFILIQKRRLRNRFLGKTGKAIVDTNSNFKAAVIKVIPPSSGLIDHAVSMRPDYHRAIVDTIIHYGWKTIIYMYDSHDVCKTLSS